MPTLANAREGLEIIRDALQDALDGDTTNFPDGADAVLSDEENEPEAAGKPYVVFEEVSDEFSDEWGMREVTANAVAKANDFNGGRIGAANTVAAHVLLSQSLITFITGQYSTLRALGVLGLEINGPRIQTVTAKDETDIQTATHRVVFRYER
jgi:hypothetical protein